MEIQYTEEGKAKNMTMTEKDSIENNIGTLASTPWASAPFLRGMGIKEYPPKDLTEMTRTKYAAEVMREAGKYEDRVKVSKVKLDEDGKGMVVIENG